MIRLDNYSSIDKSLRAHILSEINKVITIQDQYGLDDYYREILNAVKKRFNVNYSVIVGSRMSALQLSLRAVDCGCRDEVLMSTYNPSEIANAVKSIGSKTVFADINESFEIDTTSVRSKITDKTRAIIINKVLKGSDIDKKIRNISERSNIPLIEYIEDACLQTVKPGNLSGSGIVCLNFITSSFYGVGGEASIILLDNKEYYDRLIGFLGFHPSFNDSYFRSLTPVVLDPVTAAVFRVKFSHLDLLNKKISSIARIYKENLSKNIYLGGNYIFVENPGRLIEFLERKEIEICKGYSCLHLDGRFSDADKKWVGSRAEEKSDKIFKLPMHTSLEDKEARSICENIRDYLKSRPSEDSHKRRKHGKLTLVKDDKIFTVFINKSRFLNTRKGYEYFSRITDVPKSYFIEKNSKMIMAAEYIVDEKSKMTSDEILKRMGKLLSKLHQKGKVNSNGPIYETLISRDYSPKQGEIIHLLEKYQKLFREKNLYYIHGDFSQNNILFSAQKTYLVDLEEFCLSDFYFDFACVYLNTCYENDKSFSVFLDEYSKHTDFSFSKERLYINVLMRLLDRFRSVYEHKRYPAHLIFEKYFNKLVKN